MLLTKNIEVKISKRNIGYYHDKGYIDSNLNDLIIVSVNDLQEGSNKIVELQCDYCGKIVQRRYGDYIRRHKKDTINMDCCIDCKGKKMIESNLINYGTSCTLNTDDNIRKKTETWIKKYGVDNVFKDETIKNKIKSTNLDRYGFENPNQNTLVQAKREATNIEKYGTINPQQNINISRKTHKTNMKRYGYKYTTQVPFIKEKMRSSLYRNGNVPTSSQQIEVYKMVEKLGYEPILNHPEGNFSLDVAILKNGKKIDIEYDCSYWHQDIRKDVIRNKVLNSKGWNVIRILSKSKLPNITELQQAIENVFINDRHIQLIKLSDYDIAI